MFINKLLAVVMLMGLQSVLAEENTPVEATAIKNTEGSAAVRENHFAVSLGLDNYNYEEFDVMKEKGQMTFISLQGQYQISEVKKIEAQIKYSVGQLNYDGALMSNGGTSTAYQSKDKYTILNLDANYLYTVQADDLPEFDLGIGLGRRSTTDANDESPYDYRREITYNYLNYSIGHKFNLANNLDLNVTLGGSFLLSGNVKTYLSDVNPSYPDIDMKYGVGAASAYKVQTHFNYHMNDYDLFASLEYLGWAAENSEVKYGLVEPKNKTEVLSLSTGLFY